VMVMKMSNLSKTEDDDSGFDLEGTDDDSFDVEPIIETREFHTGERGSINRVKIMPSRPNIVAVSFDSSIVQIF